MSTVAGIYQQIKKHRLLAALGIIVWLFLFLLTVHRTYSYFVRMEMDFEMGFILLRALLIWGIPILFIPVFIWLARRFPIDESTDYRYGLLHLGIGLLFIPVHALLLRAVMISRYFLLHPDDIVLSSAYFFESFSVIIRWLIMISPLAYWLTVGAYHYNMYHEQFQERQLRQAKLESELVSIRLQVLKIQLHPHFLFNTLHNINSLMYEDAAKAKQILSLLKQFLQLSLNKMDRQILPLTDELEFTEIYLEIIKTRFSDRLSIQRDIDPATLNTQVPVLILQPLVENAVRHGIAKKIEPGIIKITANKHDNMLQLTVEDDGPGLQNQNLHKGIGLQNIRQRLSQLYSHHTFELNRSELGGLKVLIEVPYASIQKPILINRY